MSGPRQFAGIVTKVGEPSLTLALAMVFGVLAQAIARHVRLPGIIVLLAAGVLLGPDAADLVRPQSMGQALHAFVGFAVAIILFEGGMHMDLKRLHKQARPIRRLVTTGAVITAVGGTLAARFAMGWDWRLSILFGTLVIVTGPTVITPLVRRLRLNLNVATILEAEGIFIDAVGATIAVVALEIALVPSGASLAAGVPGVLGRLGTGAAIGLAGGFFLALLLGRRRIVPEGLENTLALAVAVAVFQVSNAVVHESGITAAIVAGMVISNTPSHAKLELLEFKQQLTVLLIATLFVLLAADVRLSDVRALGLPGLITVGLLMLVVRPLTVIASTHGTDLGWREKVFLSWLSPRGIVAAAVASLFAIRLTEAGIPGGEEVRALVFLVILATVTVQGLSGGVVARLLRLRRPSRFGYLILGANPLARQVAAALGARDPVFLVDINPEACEAARREGLEAMHGNGLEEDIMVLSQADARIACLGLTTNEHVNFLFARRIRDRFRGARLLVALETEASGVTGQMVREIGAEVLFGGERQLTTWVQALTAGLVSHERWEYSSPQDGSSAPLAGAPPRALLPIAAVRDGRGLPISGDSRLRKGDLVDLAVANDHRQEAHVWLREAGFLPAAGHPSLTAPPDAAASER